MKTTFVLGFLKSSLTFILILSSCKGIETNPEWIGQINKSETGILDDCRNFTDHVYVYQMYHCSASDSLDCTPKDEQSLLLPDSYLHCCSTDSLIVTCFKYPFFPVIWAFNLEQEGFDHLNSKFNGIEALYSRNDAGAKLIGYFGNMDPYKLKIISNGTQAIIYVESFTDIELLLAQYDFINKLNLNEKNQLLQECVAKFEAMSNMPDFSFGAVSPLITTMARILSVTKFKPFLDGVETRPQVTSIIDGYINLYFECGDENANYVYTNSKDYLNVL